MAGSFHIWRVLAALMLMLGIGGLAVAQMESGNRGIPPLDTEGLLEVDGIEVDVAGDSPQQARLNGWRIAQREGFAKLWASNTNRPAAQAPNLSDSTLDGIVSAIVVEREQVGPNRYIATLGVQFDRQRASQYVGLAGNQRRSSPMLLIPVVVTAGTEIVTEIRNPWQLAWAQFRTAESPVDYVRVSGMGADPLLVNASAARRPDVDYWQSVADFYGATNILIAEVQLHRRYPGGPATGRFVARYGLEREPLGAFTLTAANSEELPAMMRQGARRIDAIYTRAFRMGDLGPNQALIVREEPPEVEEVELVAAIPYQISFASPTSAYVDSAVAALRAVPGVEAIGQSNLDVGGVSTVVIRYRGSLDGLRGALRSYGWNTTYSGGGLQMSPAPRSNSPAPDDEDEPDEE